MTRDLRNKRTFDHNTLKKRLDLKQLGLLTALNLPVVVLDDIQGIIYSSPAFISLFSINPAEGSKLSGLPVLASAESLHVKVMQLTQDQLSFELQLILSDTPEFRRYFRIQGHHYPESDLYLISFLLLKEEKTTTLRQTGDISDYEKVADLMPVKVTNNDVLGNPVYFNKAWSEFTGLSAEEMKKKGWEDSIHPDDLPSLRASWNHSLTTGEVFEAEFRIRNRYGQYTWQLTQGLPVMDPDGNISKWITTTNDIQQLKEEEEEARAAFLQLVSHELKTPVTSIKGYVQILLKLIHLPGVNLPEKVSIKPSLERINVQVNRLTRLISRLLDLSRIEDDQLFFQKEYFSLNSLVEDTVADIRLLNPGYEIKIHHVTHCKVFGDRTKLEQVFFKILGNAVKYSPGNRRIQVEIRQDDPEKAAVSIRDWGIGIAKRDQKKIFNRFYRSSKTEAHTYAGLGIGLFLAREIVERHYGEIRVDSEPAKGSEFVVTLPCQD